MSREKSGASFLAAVYCSLVSHPWSQDYQTNPKGQRPQIPNKSCKSPVSIATLFRSPNGEALERRMTNDRLSRRMRRQGKNMLAPTCKEIDELTQNSIAESDPMWLVGIDPFCRQALG